MLNLILIRHNLSLHSSHYLRLRMHFPSSTLAIEACLPIKSEDKENQTYAETKLNCTTSNLAVNASLFPKLASSSLLRVNHLPLPKTCPNQPSSPCGPVSIIFAACFCKSISTALTCSYSLAREFGSKRYLNLPPGLEGLEGE